MSIFEKILRKEIPANIIYEDDYAIAFPDIAPQAPIHILVVPKHPAKNFSDTAQWSQEARAGYMQSINQVISQLNLADGYRLVFNTGEDGGQTVDYLHLHILAGKAMSWPPFPL